MVLAYDYQNNHLNVFYGAWVKEEEDTLKRSFKFQLELNKKVAFTIQSMVKDSKQPSAEMAATDFEIYNQNKL